MAQDKTQQSRVSPLNIPDAVYNRVFQQDPDGAAILQELALLFYDADPYVPGDPHGTSHNTGRQAVVRYLMQRSGTN